MFQRATSVWLFFSLLCIFSENNAPWLSPCRAQDTNTTTNTNTNTNTDTNTGGNNTNVNGNTNVAVLNQAAGVIVDASGVVVMKSYNDPTGMLLRERIANAKANLSPELAKPSKLRKVSLTRLEKAAATALAKGESLTDEMWLLAGLTRLEYIFIYPEHGEIVIAGPAEGYALDPLGRAVGIQSGRATLELQDLVVALRAFPPTGQHTDVVGVSIDPTPEGLARSQEFLKFAAKNAGPNDGGRVAEGLRQAVGLQNVTINGVAPQTHFAQVLVEADYRMKLIGIGLEPPPVRMQSYVDRASSKSSSNSLQRWYFVPDYEALRLSDDGLAMRLEGNGVKLVSADEVVLADGKRASTKSVDKASRGFVRDFTEKYAAIAERAPVYGQLRNLVDLLVAAAFLQEHDYYGQADWKATVFGDEQILSVEQHPSPRQVETAVNAVWKGARLMFPMGGGVRIQARDALSDNNVVSDDSGSVAREREEGVSFDKLDPARWWWD